MTDIVLLPITNSANVSVVNDNNAKIQQSINEDILHLAGGNNTMLQQLDMNSNKIINIQTDPNDPDSMVTVGAGDSRWYNVAGDTLTGTMNAGGQRIINLPVPVGATEPVRKGEYDSQASDLVQAITVNKLQSVRGQDGEQLTPLPPAASRANKVMGFDASGNPLAILPASGSGTELAIDLANPVDPSKGAGMVAWRRSPLAAAVGSTIDTVGEMLNAQSVNILEYAHLATGYSDGSDPGSWDWSPAGIAAAYRAAGKTLVIPYMGWIYNFSAAVPYTTGGFDRIASVVFLSNTRIVIDPGVTIRPINYGGPREFRAIFATLGQSNVHFTGGCLFDGLVPPGSSTTGKPKVGLMFQESKFCSATEIRAQNFAFHGAGCYAGDGGGSEDIDFIRVKSVAGTGSSLVAYSSVANYGHAPNKRIRFIDCHGLDSPGYFGVELRGCEDSEVIGGLYTGNLTGGVNIEENSHRVRVLRAEITGNGQGLIISGNQGACNDVITEDCFIHGNTASQWANYAGNRAKIIRTRIKGGATTGVNILTPPSGLPVADGVEIIDSEITGNGGVGILNRGTNTKLSGTVVTGNTGADVQVSNSGMCSIDSTVGVWAYDSTARRVNGYSTDVDATLNASSFNIKARYSQDGDRARLVGESIAGNTEFGSIDFVRNNATNGRVEVYGLTAGVRTLSATFSSAGALTPGSDNTQTLGSSGLRWSVVYAGTGTINTSDERAKQDIRDISEVESRVAAALKRSIKTYRMRDAVAEKGAEARIHCGVIAQEVVEAFAIEGLDATRYGILCYDEWDAVYEDILEELPVMEDGMLKFDEAGAPMTEWVAKGEKKLIKEAGSRYGVRYDELAMFILSSE